MNGNYPLVVVGVSLKRTDRDAEACGMVAPGSAVARRGAAELVLGLVGVTLVIFPGAGLFVALHDRWAPPLPVTVLPAVLVSAVVALIGCPVSIALHELGHAWAVRSHGWQVTSVRIGSGGLLWAPHVKGVPVKICVRPFAGETRYNAPSTATVRQLRRVVRAGPLANAILALGAWASALVVSPLVAIAFAGFAWLNLMLLASNMVDQHPTTGTQGSDGWQLGELRGLAPGLTRHEIPPWHGRPELTEDPAIVARRLLRRLRGGSLDPVQVRDGQILLAYQCGRLGHFEQAAAVYEDLCRTELPQELRVALQANWADARLSAAVVAGKRPSVDDLARCREATDAARGRPGVRHTTALLALAEGKPSEAVELAEESLAETALLPEDRAIVEATISLAHAECGDKAKAREWLERVPETCPFHEAASRALL